MPLVKGSSQKAVSTNISRLMKEVGQSKHVQSSKQAIAIALSMARRMK